MKSLVIKDLYNIGHNTRQMFVLLLFLAICFIPSTGSAAFIIMSTIMCSMMTITTFSFDERSKWEKFALIMPVSRKEYITGKYVVDIVFSMAGILFGVIAAFVIGTIKGNCDLTEIMGCAIASLFVAIFYGSLIIPLMIKFGTESARLIMLGTTAVPALILFGLYKMLTAMGIDFTGTLLLTVLGIAAICILLLALLSYELSNKWFEKKEF